jgi:hypothetical protein
MSFEAAHLRLLVCILLVIAVAVPARGQGLVEVLRLHAPDSGEGLQIYAVDIYRTGRADPFGSGVLLGDGYVLTAAHVAGLGLWREPRVGVAGEVLPTRVIKDGHFHNVDLELLQVDEMKLPVALALRRMQVCREPRRVGDPVVVATTKGVTRSIIMSPRRLPPGIAPRFQSVVRHVAGMGESGTAVFDAYRKCLRGIIVRRISGTRNVVEDGKPVVKDIDIARVFIPATDIAKFLPPAARF